MTNPGIVGPPSPAPISVTGVPSAGQIPLATSARAAAWAAVPATKQLLASSTYNFSPSSMRVFRAAMARALSGGTNAHIAFGGDSTTYGNGLTDALGIPSLFRNILVAKGVPSRGTGILHLVSLAGSTARNPIVTTSGTSTFNAGPIACGGFLTGGGGGSIVVAPAVGTDLFTVYYIQLTSSGGTITTKVDTVASTSLVCTTTGSNKFATQTFAVASGSTHTLELDAPASGNGFLWGIECRSGGSTGGVRVSNLGVSGRSSIGASSSTANGAVSPLQGITPLGADLLVLNLGINDGAGAGPDQGGVQTSLATYLANMQAIITQQKTTGGVAGTGGDVVLVAFNPQQTAFSPLTQAQYVAQLYTLADTNDIPLIDLQTRWTSYAVSNPAPISFYADGTHPSAAGNSDIANVIYYALASVGVGI